MAALPQPPLVYADAVPALLQARQADGGFAETPGGDYRPDATAWATLCLDSFQLYPELSAAARGRLSAGQQPDGGIPLSADYPEAFWPTAAAAMALQGSPQFAAAHDRAVGFLLATTGQHSPREDDSPLGHDPSIPGWPWIADTHSWVEPTAMAIRALTLAGHSAHPRVQSGVKMLLDRQLPDGGWNYGNTTVYGKTLNPMPAATGVALWSLAGLAEADKVAPSLDLIARELPKLRTPLSLGWALSGLTDWRIETGDARALITDCLQRQQKFGPYGTSRLALLLIAASRSGAGNPRS